MAHDTRFDSAWFKWAQAIVHANALQAEIKASASDGYREPLFSARADYEPHRHGFAVTEPHRQVRAVVCSFQGAEDRVSFELHA